MGFADRLLVSNKGNPRIATKQHEEGFTPRVGLAQKLKIDTDLEPGAVATGLVSIIETSKLRG